MKITIEERTTVCQEKLECAIDAIGDAIENRRLYKHGWDKGLAWALEILKTLRISEQAQG